MSVAAPDSFDEARAALAAVCDGRGDASGLVAKGDGVEQLAGFAAALQDRCESATVGDERPVVCCAGEVEPPHLSLAIAAVSAAAGVAVAVHDGWPARSQLGIGIADIAAALGAGTDGAAASLSTTGIGIFSTDAVCPAWARVRPLPEPAVLADAETLLAPAPATAHLVGVPPGRSAAQLLAALCRLDVRRAIAVTAGEHALELCDGAIAEVDLGRWAVDARPVAAEAAASLTRAILAGAGPAAEVATVAQGAGLRLYAAWRAPTPAAGVVAARAALASGAAAQALDRFVSYRESAEPCAA